VGKDKKGLFSKLRNGLSRSREQFSEKIENVFAGKKEIDEETFDDLEEALITSDIGFETAQLLIEAAKSGVKRKNIDDISQLKAAIKKEMFKILKPREIMLPVEDLPIAPFVIFFMGVNGAGKTTTIGKLALNLKEKGKNVLLAAADTFRAAATPQLELWSKRAGVDVISHKNGSDPSAVVYDAIQAAQFRRMDFLLVDTAGRLHTRKNLMEELKKMCRIADKVMPGAPHEKLLVLDATNGQNALSQTRMYHEAVKLTGLAMTKLDSTSKGGILLQLAHEFDIPIRLVGVGENPQDLRNFDAGEFADAML
jgi:fused signal recognition particle receptor